MRRLIPLLLLLPSCAEVQRPGPRRSVTCTERCLQDELVCLDDIKSTIGGLNLGIFFFGSGNSGAALARRCEVEGELCRIQNCAPPPRSVRDADAAFEEAPDSGEAP